MKKPRCLPVLAFLFLPTIASTQVLIASDIDIFLNSWSSIESIRDSHRQGDRHWKKYNAALEPLGDTISPDHEEEESIWFAGFTRRYNQLMKVRAPRELAEYFQSIGWGQQGNKKFWTILMGTVFLLIPRERQNSREGNGAQREYLLEKIISLFDPADMRIIESRLDDLIAALSSG